MSAYRWKNFDENEDRPAKPRRYGVTEMRSPHYNLFSHNVLQLMPLLQSLTTGIKGHFWKSQFTAAKGAYQLLLLQEDVRKQFKVDGSGPENDVDSHIRLNKDTLMNSLWKLNVVDIEATIVHVCQLIYGIGRKLWTTKGEEQETAKKDFMDALKLLDEQLGDKALF